MVIEKIKEHAHTVRSEFKKQTSTAIMAAFGLVIALAWKDVITEWINKIPFIENYGSIISAVILTIICVIGILIISKWMNSSSENKK